MIRKVLLAGVLLISVIGFTFAKGSTEQQKTDITGTITNQSESLQEPVELLVYSGAGLKKAMEEIKKAFETENNVIITYVYAGSAQLISQIELSGKGDVFIVGSEKVYKSAIEKGYSDEFQRVAHHTPCIAVQVGNPKGITCLEDLAGDGITVILGDPKANAIGMTTKKIIEKTGLNAISNNTVSLTSTVNEIVTQIASGQADAGIVTFDGAHSNKYIEIIEIPENQNIDQIIPVGTLIMSKEPETARNFVDFIASIKGKAIFKGNGFRPVE